MTEPRLEAELGGGVVLWDVSHMLPARRAPMRNPKRIRRLYVHHSGVLGRPGIAGAEATARYVVKNRGWPCVAYHYWLPYEPLEDEDGRLVVLRLAPDNWRTFHTGGRANTHGLGVCLQGNTSERPLSEVQTSGLEALFPWLRQQYAGQLHGHWLAWHSNAARWGGKPKGACPGTDAETWLRSYLDSLGATLSIA